MRRPPGPRKGTTAVLARPKTMDSHALARMPAVPAARVRRSPLPRRRPRTLATGVCGRPGPAFPAEPGGRCHAGTPLAVRPETVSAQSGANARSPGPRRSSKRTRTDTLVYRYARVPVKWRGGERGAHPRDEQRTPGRRRTWTGPDRSAPRAAPGSPRSASGSSSTPCSTRSGFTARRRLAPAVQHQTTQIAGTQPPLIPPRQRPEHIGNEPRQLTPEPFRLPQLHPGGLPATSRDHSTQRSTTRRIPPDVTAGHTSRLRSICHCLGFSGARPRLARSALARARAGLLGAAAGAGAPPEARRPCGPVHRPCARCWSS